ncbi:hypothetical protein ACFE04_013946 [Oxalis oulophora]
MSNKQSFRYNFCFCFKRIFRLNIVEPPAEIRGHFITYSAHGYMSVDQLRMFLIEVQKEENARMEDAQAIFDHLSQNLKHLNVNQRKGLTLQSFFRYLLDDINTPLPGKVHHDMSAPLAHYFLFTGHNSYLTGNQLTSDSSIHPIVDALRRGVRVIELDLWPEEDGVKVCHGGTLTSNVDLLKCLVAIKENAFVASEFPVVITFEDHLSSHLQKKVANMVVKTFGETLYTPASELKNFPSPNDLKGKVLISTKPPSEYLESPSSKKEDSQYPEDDSDQTPNRQPGLGDLCTPCFGSRFTSSKKESSLKYKGWEEEDSESDKEHNLPEYEEEEDEESAAPAYKNLIAIHAGKLKGGSSLDLLSLNTEKARRVSLSEQVLRVVVKEHGEDMVRFTRKNIVRVYPKGTRITSSNYNPCVGWAHGAQMVAFNMQYGGKHLWIMQGMFRANGQCGYVKKPDFLLRDSVIPIKKTLKVKVYLGEGWHSDFRHTHFDLCSPPDFYVKLRIAGVKADVQKVKTNTVQDKWLPVWDQEFKFKLTVPELALLRLEVRDEDTAKPNEFGGQTCLPISELKSGIRSVSLYNEKGVIYKSVRLLMGFEFITEED